MMEYMIENISSEIDNTVVRKYLTYSDAWVQLVKSSKSGFKSVTVDDYKDNSWFLYWCKETQCEQELLARFVMLTVEPYPAASGILQTGKERSVKTMDIEGIRKLKKAINEGFVFDKDSIEEGTFLSDVYDLCVTAEDLHFQLEKSKLGIDLICDRIKNALDGTDD